MRNVGISNAEKREEKEKERDEEEFEEETLSHECFFKEEEEENEARVVRRVKAVGEKGEMGPKKPPSRCKPIFSLKKSLSASTHNDLPSFPPASSSSSSILDRRVDSTSNPSDGRLDGEIYELLYHTLGEENVRGGNWRFLEWMGTLLLQNLRVLSLRLSPELRTKQILLILLLLLLLLPLLGILLLRLWGQRSQEGGGSFITDVDESLSTTEEAGIAPSDASSGASSSSSSSSSAGSGESSWVEVPSLSPRKKSMKRKKKGGVKRVKRLSEKTPKEKAFEDRVRTSCPLTK